MIQGNHNVGNILELPLGRLTYRHIYKGHVKLHWEDPVSIVNIIFTPTTLRNTMYSHRKLIGL